MKNLGRKIGGLILTLAFVFGISAVAGVTTQAQYRNDDGRYQRQRDHGKKDKKWKKHRNRDDEARNRELRRARNSRDRRDGRSSNNGSYGRNGGYNNNDQYNNRNQIELNQGYQAGLNTGASDGQRGQSYNPQRSRNFKNASTQAFREGFVRGYDEGYRQYSRNGNQNGNQSNSGWGQILGGILGRP